MRNISKQFRELLDGDRHLMYYADIILADGTEINLTNRNLMQGDGFKIEDAVSNSGVFDIGAVIIGQLTLRIDNQDDTYSNYDFSGAVVAAYVGAVLPDKTVEKVRMGTYTVDEAQSSDFLITLKCIDNLSKFDKPYSESKLKYPATLNEIVRDACAVCDVTLQTVAFDNDDFVIEKHPADEAATFREVLRWVAQISVKFCRCDAYGGLTLGWYNQKAFEDIDRLDGGFFSPWSGNDTVSGGTFKPWTEDNVIDGKTFQNQNTYHHLFALFSQSVSTDDVVITGVSVEEQPEEPNTEAIIYTTGQEGYIVSIERNALIQSGNGAMIAEYLGKKLIGLRFREAKFSHISDPSIEAGDVAYLTDRRQNVYQILVSSTTFKAGDSQDTESCAETPMQNSSTRFSEATKNYIAARKLIEKEKTAREKALEDLNLKLAESSGLYTSKDQLEDGSYIYYMHDKPVLSESMIVWKMTANAFGVSTDGGKTWNAGLTVDGDAITRILSAVGINFDWAHGGTIKLGGKDNQNGSLEIYDAAGEMIGHWNNLGAGIKGKVESDEGEIAGFRLSKEGLVSDISGPANYSLADLKLLRQILLSLTDQTDELLKAYDTNGDGKLSSADALLVQRYMIGAETPPTITGEIKINPGSTDKVIEITGKEGVFSTRKTRLGIGIVESTMMQSEHIMTRGISVGPYKEGGDNGTYIGEDRINVNGHDVVLENNDIFDMYTPTTHGGAIKIKNARIMIQWNSMRIYVSGAMSQWGSLYETMEIGSLSWDIPFAETPHTTVSAYCPDEPTDIIVSRYKAPTATSPGSVFLVRATPVNELKTYEIVAFGIGKY